LFVYFGQLCENDRPKEFCHIIWHTGTLCIKMHCHNFKK